MSLFDSTTSSQTVMLSDSIVSSTWSCPQLQGFNYFCDCLTKLHNYVTAMIFTWLIALLSEVYTIPQTSSELHMHRAACSKCSKLSYIGGIESGQILCTSNLQFFSSLDTIVQEVCHLCYCSISTCMYVSSKQDACMYTTSTAIAGWFSIQ